ncbi:hypothetical protein BGZ54_003349 [Gamsiella multidivaricata]|nr:hypothetical protein BGZ54_003349 [Gamsiella multidivaricata]
MDRLPAHFRQEPSRWKDISSFMSKRPNNDANTHYKAFGGFLHLIHDTSEAGYYEKTIALELLNTITSMITTAARLPSSISFDETGGCRKSARGPLCERASLIIYAEDELVKDITKQQHPTTNQREKEFVRK